MFRRSILDYMTFLPVGTGGSTEGTVWIGPVVVSTSSKNQIITLRSSLVACCNQIYLYCDLYKYDSYGKLIFLFLHIYQYSTDNFRITHHRSHMFLDIHFGQKLCI